MPDLVNYDGFFPDKEAESIIAGAKSIPTGQVAGECFGAAHGRPFLQPLQQPKNPIPNGPRQPVQLLRGLGRQLDRCHPGSMAPLEVEVKILDSVEYRAKTLPIAIYDLCPSRLVTSSLALSKTRARRARWSSFSTRAWIRTHSSISSKCFKSFRPASKSGGGCLPATCT